jgi:hypothetical protein
LLVPIEIAPARPTFTPCNYLIFNRAQAIDLSDQPEGMLTRDVIAGLHCIYDLSDLLKPIKFGSAHCLAHLSLTAQMEAI